MLDSIIPELEYTSTYGSSVLKALQNDNLPELDLLVREAIQNSSDAAIGMPDKSFNVNFTFGSFNPKIFNGLLKDVSQILDERYKNSADYMEIRDYKTSGLTGPVRKADLDPLDHGNYFKLVFDTGKEQSNSSSGEAGGSWGYGKSVYYRIGIGLVLFYSRIRTEKGLPESRLIVSLIEHETGENSILKKVKKSTVGRAWWGRQAPDNDTELLPLTNENDIRDILTIFGVKPFTENQTGTAIIIPYINKERLLSGIYPDNCGVPPEEIAMCSYKDNIDQYISLAIQKWYAPKIFNKALEELPDGLKWLNARVNGNVIKNTSSYMRPFFLLVQELYNVALFSTYDKSYTPRNFTEILIKKEKIPSARIEGQWAGIVSFARVTKDDLGNSVIQPYTYLRLFGKTSANDPIVMFARTPGMVLDYKIDGPWTKNLIKPEDDDEYFVAFFVPKCKTLLKNNMAIKDLSHIPLGEYLRKCEKSDHMDWNDPSSMTVVTNIKHQINNKINQMNKVQDSGPVEGTASKLSGKLGKRLLPSLNFGKKSGGSGGNGGNGGGKTSNLEFSLLTPEYEGEAIVKIPFIAEFKNSRKEAYFGLFVETEVALMDAFSWEANIETPFPISIVCIKDCSIISLNSGETVDYDGICEKDHPAVLSNYSTITIVTDETGTSTSGFKISNEITNAVIEGVLIISADDKKYCLTIKESRLMV